MLLPGQDEFGEHDSSVDVPGVAAVAGEDVAVEGHGLARVVVREDRGVDAEVHAGHASCRWGAAAS